MASSKIQKILAIATTVCVILTGILFIICCAHLYFTGGELVENNKLDHIYSRERVGDYLLVTAIPSVITVLLVIGGFITSAITGAQKDETTKRTKIELLESFSKRYDINDFEGETKDEILKLRKNRDVFKYIAYSFSAAVFVVILVYMCFFAKFSTEAKTINADIIASLAFALPMSAIALGIHIPRLYVAESSAEKELALMRSYVKENNIQRSKIPEGPAKKRVSGEAIARYVILAVAIVFIVLGIFNGGMKSMLGKAVQICLECIGIG